MVDKCHDKGLSTKDNYADFSNKLDSAIELLKTRLGSVSNAWGMVFALSEESSKSLLEWVQRLADIDKMIEKYSGGPEGYEALSDLQSTANRMETSFRRRTETIKAKLAEVDETKTRINTALADLRVAKRKLESSREESEARAALDRISSQITTGEIVLSGTSTALQNDIAQARLAIASAEALVEIKDSRHV